MLCYRPAMDSIPSYVLRRTSVAGLGVFLVSMALAMALHPAHSFLGSFWCDLFASPTPTGAAFARLGLAGFAIAVLPLWLALPRFLPAAPRSARVARGLGIASLAAMAGVAASPGGTSAHGIAILAACGPAFPAILLALRAQALRPETRGAAWLGLAMLAVSVGNFVQYAREQWFAVPAWDGLPAVQKVATILIVVWVGATLRTR